MQDDDMSIRVLYHNKDAISHTIPCTMPLEDIPPPSFSTQSCTLQVMAQKSLKKNAVFNFVKTLANFAFSLITFLLCIARTHIPKGIGRINFVNLS